MKSTGSLIIALLLAGSISVSAFAQTGPRILSNNRLFRIIKAGRIYSMVEFTPYKPLKIEVKGPGRLIVYIKTAIPSGRRGLSPFRLFVKRDNYKTNLYSFPRTRRSNLSFKRIKNYNPSMETKSIPINVPGGLHTYKIFPGRNPYVIGLASFKYTKAEIQPTQMIKHREIKQMAGAKTFLYGVEKTFYIKSYGLIGDVYEQGTNNNSLYAGAGANIDMFIQKHFALSGMINYTDANQRYLVWRNLPMPIGAGIYIVNEQTLLVHALFSYVFLHNRENTIMAGAGWGDLELINSAFPGEVNGPVLGALIKTALSQSMELSLRASYMQDVSNISANTNSILGTPYSLLLYPVGLAFHLTSDISVEAGYDGRLLTFKDTNRFYNGGFIAAVF